jgi:uncharacterized membrane protein HdeD (DUF308 family)
MKGIAMSTVKPDLSGMQAALATSLSAHWKLFLIEGIVLVILGVAAVMLPLIATIAIAVVGFALIGMALHARNSAPAAV